MIYRTSGRHRLIDPTKRQRKRSGYKRWERSRSMELWQMGVFGRLFLKDGTEVKFVTGIDDHSMFCVCARNGPGPACADVGIWIGALADRLHDLRHNTLAALVEDGRRRSWGTVQALLGRHTCLLGEATL
jgi:hypothetical protein